MTLYIGVDIQTLSFLDTEDGTTGQLELQHERDDVKEFYRKFQGEVIVGIEACGYINWFEELTGLKLTMPSFSVVARKRRSETAVDCRLVRRSA